MSESGRRCDATAFLELDHIVPVAKGGRSTVENLRERCRTRNQYTARREFGSYAAERRARGESASGARRL